MWCCEKGLFALKQNEPAHDIAKSPYTYLGRYSMGGGKRLPERRVTKGFSFDVNSVDETVIPHIDEANMAQFDRWKRRCEAASTTMMCGAEI